VMWFVAFFIGGKLDVAYEKTRMMRANAHSTQDALCAHPNIWYIRLSAYRQRGHAGAVAAPGDRMSVER